MKAVSEHGGAVEAVPYMKAQLVESNRERVAKIERGEIVVVGQNAFTSSEDSPLTTGEDGGILTPDPEVERERIEALEQWKAERDQAAVDAALADLAAAAADERANVMPATIAAARAGATTGEWSGTLRDAFGDYRGPTGVTGAPQGERSELLEAARARVESVTRRPSAIRSASSSPSPASTAIRTAPSRSPSAPATSAWRSSTRGSA